MDIAGLTVKIDGDVSGLLSEVERAKAAAAVLEKNYSYAFARIKNDLYKSQRERIERYVNTYDLSGAQEKAAWDNMRSRFGNDAYALAEINEKAAEATRRMWEEEIEAHKFALEMGYTSEEEYYSWLAQYRDTNFTKWTKQYNEATLELKKYSDSFYDTALKQLDGYEDEFDKWISHSIKMGELNADEQAAAYGRFAENYNALVSQIVATTQLGAEEVNALWSKAYEIRHESEEKIHSIVGGEYERWLGDMQGWIDLRATYGDWESYGDSLSQTYARAIERVKEFYEAGTISWQECEDKKLEYSLAMYRAAGDEYDAVLDGQAAKISELRDEFAREEEELRTSWEVSDRKEELDEVNALLAIYKNASTEKGKARYNSLLDTKEKLMREQQLYNLEVRNNQALEELEKEYKMMEARKSALLSQLRYTGGDISATSSDIRDIARAIGVDYVNSAQSTLEALSGIADILTGISKRMRSTNTYNDNKTVNIAGGMSESAVSRVINGTVVSGLGSVIFGG